MIKVSTSIEIEAPADDVFAYVSDFSNNPDWQSGVESAVWTSPPPHDVGSTYDQTVEYKSLVTSYTITAIERGRSITTESHPGAVIPTTVTRSVRAVTEDRCLVTVDLVGHPGRLRRLAQPLLARAVRKSIESDYRHLRQLLEPTPDPE